MDNKKLAELRYFYATHFYEFVKDILGYKDLTEHPHRELCNFLVDTPGDGSNRTSNIQDMPLSSSNKPSKDKRRLGVFIPRDSFKTTICTVSYPVWRWIRNPNLRILIGSHNIDKAREFLQEIKDQLSQNQKLIALFGDMGKACREKNATWSRDAIQLFDPVKNQYVPFRNMNSCRVIGMGTSFTGLHPDIAIFDDLVCEQNISSPDMLEKPKTFLRYIEPLLSFGTEIIIVGTRYHWGDAYQEIIEDGMYDVILRSAINPDGSLWYPERLNWEYLKSAQRRLGTYIYSCQYLLNPVRPEDAIFKEDWINRSVFKSCPIDVNELTRIMVIDPSARSTKISDYTAILIAGMDTQGNIWVLRAFNKKSRIEELIDEIIDIYKVWKPEAIAVESNVFQALVKDIIEMKAEQRGEFINIRPIETSTRQSKEWRIRRIIPLLEAGKIKILEECWDLITEMRRFPKGSDDLLDCLANACKILVPPEEVQEPNWEKIEKEYKESWEICKGVKELEDPEVDLFQNLWNI